jgi:hypothetical protein
MNITIDESIAPEIVQVLIAQAALRGVSVNDYLRNLLGLNNGANTELALAGAGEENGAQASTPFESIEDLIGVFDSREPFERSRKEPDAFGRGVIAKLEKQGVKLP